MRKVFVIPAVVVIVLVLVAVLAGPWYIGKRIESTFPQTVAQLAEKTGLKATVTKYHRGWFHSQATVVVDGLPHGMGHVKLLADITHGPRHKLVWASIRGHVTSDGEVLNKLFADESALHFSVYLRPFDKPVVKLASPETKLTRGDRHFIWGGATAVVKPGKMLQVDLPRIDVGDKQGGLLIKDISLESHGAMVGLDLSHVLQNPAKWDTATTLRVGQFAWDPPRHYYGRAGHFHAMGRGTLDMQLQPGDDGTLDLAARLDLDNVRLLRKGSARKPLVLNSVSYDLNFSGVHGEATIKWLRAMRKVRAEIHRLMQFDDLDQDDLRKFHTLQKSLQKHYIAMWSGSPRMTMQLQALQQDRKVLDGDFNLALRPGSQAASTDDPGIALRKRLSADLNYNMRIGLLQSILAYATDRPADMDRLKVRLTRDNGFGTDAHSILRLAYDHDGNLTLKLRYDGKTDVLTRNGEKVSPATRQDLIRQLNGLHRYMF